MQEILDRLEAKNKEQAELLAVLRMWSKVQEQGIDPEEVQSFAFDPNLLTHQERQTCMRRNRLLGICGIGNNPYNFPIVTNEAGQQMIRPLKYNVVIMKDGSRKTLNPIVESPNGECS